MLTAKDIDSYTSVLDCGDDKKRKVKTVLTRFMEYQIRNSLDSVTESDISAFMAENAGKWKQTVTYENHIREYFRFPKIKPKREDTQLNLEITETLQSEERSIVSSMNEEVTVYEPETVQSEAVTDNKPVKQASKRRGVKRVQVSVYLNPETYSILHTLSSVTRYSVSDMLSKAGDELAKKNYNTAMQVKERLQGFTMEY